MVEHKKKLKEQNGEGSNIPSNKQKDRWKLLTQTTNYYNFN